MSDVKTEIMDVGPGEAEDLLGLNINNRKLRGSKVREFAAAMSRGEWRFTGEAVQIDEDGRLANGQHRLSAIIESGCTVQLLIVWGVPRNAKEVMDTGTKRSAADALAMRGVANPVNIASLCRLLIAEEMLGSLSRAKSIPVTHPQIIEMQMRDPDGISEAVRRATPVRKVTGITPAVAAYAYYRLAAVDVNAADDFYNGLTYGANLDVGNPILTLREKILETRGRRVQYDPAVWVSMFYRAWNAWRNEKQLTFLRSHVDGKPVPIPVPR